VLKNAIDYLYAEWNNKAAAFVSYGSLGGARAIEHLRAICSELQIAHVRQQLSFSLFNDFQNISDFNPATLHDDAAEVLFGQLDLLSTRMNWPAPASPRSPRRHSGCAALVRTAPQPRVTSASC
jgi:NAD(P)H-dependent FMN reductase